MFSHGLHTGVTKRAIAQWFLLAFSAGDVNAGGYLACERFVSHVTGFATLAGVDFAAGQWKAALGSLAVPCFFLLGVVVSAYFVDRRASRGEKPRYALIMGLVSLCLFMVAFGGSRNWFGVFGAGIVLRKDLFFLALLCMASGLQNAAITTASGATVRTTHLTGVTTDLGIGIVRFFSHPPRSEAREYEWTANVLRGGTILAFMLGGLAGAILFLKVKYLGFLLPAFVTLYSAAYAIVERRREDRAAARP